MKINSNYNIGTINKQPSFKRNWEEHISWGVRFAKESQKADFKLFTFPDAKAVFVEIANSAKTKFGKIKERVVKVLGTQGAGFTVNEIYTKNEESKLYPLENKGEGIFETKNIEVEEGAEYRYIIVDKNDEVKLVKDPYAKKQTDINGWSEIYNSDNYEWQATDWIKGNDPRKIVRKPNEPLRGLENLIIEEINIPTVSQEGTFEKAIKHIDRISEKGIATAVEIMPVENTYSLQWGYDGVDKFAVNEKMGGSVKLKELIDYAHSKGLNVIMDMVPNHIGPDGNYLTQTGPYIKGAADFGDALNYEGASNKYVRDWITNAALWWIDEYKVDGLRLDMTKYCASDYLLKQIVAEVNTHKPDIFMIAEDGRDNKHTVTTYNIFNNTHEKELENIDQSIAKIANREWHTYPNELGFDSEWDFVLMHELKDGILNPDSIKFDKLDEAIKNSKYRVKYVMSHDEIGNLDGTRLIPKVITAELDLFSKTKGYNNAEKGQKAAHLGQKLAELCLSNKTIDEKKFNEFLQNTNYINGSIDFEKMMTAFNIAFAKQKFAHATIMSLPGPKLYFQGDDEIDLSYFKFFREFSGDKYNREHDKNYVQNIINNKGYDTLESIARPDSILRNINSKNTNEYIEKMKTFCTDLDKVLKTSQTLQKGEIVDTYTDNYNKIHTHRLKYGNDEILVIKNFGKNFHDNYEIWGLQENKWTEIFNSDSKKYGGLDFVNTNRTILPNKQDLRIAPSAVIILKKI